MQQQKQNSSTCQPEEQVASPVKVSAVALKGSPVFRALSSFAEEYNWDRSLFPVAEPRANETYVGEID